MLSCVRDAFAESWKGMVSSNSKKGKTILSFIVGTNIPNLTINSAPFQCLFLQARVCLED